MKLRKFLIISFTFTLIFAIFLCCSSTYSKSREVKILFGGDLMLDRYVKTKVYKNFKGEYFRLFEYVTNYLNSFDYVVVNLEGPVSNKGEKVGSIYSFRMEPKALKSLIKANVKVVNLANNHIWDYGKEAFLDTLKNLKENNILYIGAGENFNEAYLPLILEKDGTKIGILSFTEFLKHVKAKNEKPGIAYLDEKIFEKIVSNTKRKVDILIVIFHWGEEYKYEPSKNQIYFAHKAVDLGADLIIGHHPHIVQKIEKYKDKYIFYSLGNFIFDQNFSLGTMKGGLVEVEIENKKIKNIYFRWLYLNNNFQIEKISERLILFEIKGKIYKLLIADEPSEWEKGLMFIKKPVDYDGMLFIFPDKQIRYFWNKNTFLDLDIYWLYDDKIIGKNTLLSINKTKKIHTIQSPAVVNKVIEIIK